MSFLFIFSVNFFFGCFFLGGLQGGPQKGSFDRSIRQSMDRVRTGSTLGFRVTGQSLFIAARQYISTHFSLDLITGNSKDYNLKVRLFTRKKLHNIYWICYNLQISCTSMCRKTKQLISGNHIPLSDFLCPQKKCIFGCHLFLLSNNFHF